MRRLSVAALVVAAGLSAGGVHDFRMPALAATRDGTPIEVYSTLLRSESDLPNDIDVMECTSRDIGLPWSAGRMLDAGPAMHSAMVALPDDIFGIRSEHARATSTTPASTSRGWTVADSAAPLSSDSPR